MTRPVLTFPPTPAPDKHGSDPAAFDVAMQALLNWLVDKLVQMLKETLDYIDVQLPAVVNAGAVTAANAAGAASAANSAAAQLAAQQAAAALASTGVSKTYLSFAAAQADLGSIAAGAIVRVLVDETLPGFTTWYQRVGGALVLGLKQDMRAVVGAAAHQVPQHWMLGTAAYMDQTWLHASFSAPGVTTNLGQVAPAFTALVPGAVPGDFVLVSTSINQQGVVLYGYVPAADAVTVVYASTQGSTTLPAHPLFVRVIKRLPE